MQSKILGLVTSQASSTRSRCCWLGVRFVRKMSKHALLHSSVLELEQQLSPCSCLSRQEKKSISSLCLQPCNSISWNIVSIKSKYQKKDKNFSTFQELLNTFSTRLSNVSFFSKSYCNFCYCFSILYSAADKNKQPFSPETNQNVTWQ